MASIEELSRYLLASERDAARALYNEALALGHAPLRAAALVYRAGRLAGKEESKAREKAAYKALQAARDRIAELEGAAAAAPEGADSPTPGEEMEVETHE